MQSIRKALGGSRTSTAHLTADGFSVIQGGTSQSGENGIKIKNAHLNNFELGTTLGTGTFGRVRLVDYISKTDASTHVYAMKILKKTEILRLKQLAHVKNEIELLGELDHPFIVNMVSFFQDESRVYMILEYVPGGELFTYLRNEGRLQNDEANFYAAQIVLAFGYLHSRDVAYRDLKPENLLITRTGYLKIADFGFAKKIKDRTFTLCGTPEYLAPEIIQSKGHGCPADWWALGVLIFEMLAGFPPFYAESAIGIYQRILHGAVDYPQHIEGSAVQLLKKLLQADLTKRIGCLKNGVTDIVRSKWFANTDFRAIFQEKQAPAYIPTVLDEKDTSNFDQYPESKPGSTKPPHPEDASKFDEFDEILQRLENIHITTDKPEEEYAQQADQQQQLVEEVKP